MPNYVRHELTVTGAPSVLKRFKRKVKGENGDFDFNSIVPMPSSLDIEEGANTARAIMAYLSANCTKPLTPALRAECEKYGIKNQFSPDWVGNVYVQTKESIDENGVDFPYCFRSASNPDDELNLSLYDAGAVYVSNVDNYGTATWYSWSIKNWGCKWNACDPSVSDVDDNTVGCYFDTAWSCCAPIFEKLTEMFPTLNMVLEYADEDIGSNCGRFTWHNKKLAEWYPSGEKASREFANKVWGYDEWDEEE